MLKSRLKIVLAEEDKTQTWIAEQMNVARKTVNAWANNRVTPSLEQSWRLGMLLKRKQEELWVWVEEDS